jgi:hypothetical protein
VAQSQALKKGMVVDVWGWWWGVKTPWFGHGLVMVWDGYHKLFIHIFG